MSPFSRLIDVTLRGTRAAQPAATITPPGSLYFVTDENVTERVSDDGTVWQSYSGSGAGSGTVTNTGTLTANLPVVGNGGVDVKILAAGSALQVLRMNAAATAVEFATMAGTGDVVGPASSVDNAVARFDGTTGKLIQNSAVTIADTTGLIAGSRFANTGLKLEDTNASHLLTIAPGSDLTADRTLTITTGDAARTLTLTGDASITGTNTGDQTITLTGDVTGSGTGSFAATIANDAVTFAKMQNIATDRLIGRDTAATGDPEELSVGGGLEFTGSAGIQRSALTGDVTASAGSNSTTIANDAVTFAKLQNIATDRLLGRDTAGSGDTEELTVSSGIEFTGSGGIRATTPLRTRAIGITIDGGGSAITTGVKGDAYVPFACTITAVTMLADQSGSAVVDIWKDTYANYPPTVADTITASAKPTITTATKSQDTTLTGWTTSISAGETLRFNVDSATTITRLTLTLTVTL